MSGIRGPAFSLLLALTQATCSLWPFDDHSEQDFYYYGGSKIPLQSAREVASGWLLAQDDTAFIARLASEVRLPAPYLGTGPPTPPFLFYLAFAAGQPSGPLGTFFRRLEADPRAIRIFSGYRGSDGDPLWVTGEIAARAKDSTADSLVERFARDAQLDVVRRATVYESWILRVTRRDQDPVGLANGLYERGFTAYAEPVFAIRLDMYPSAPLRPNPEMELAGGGGPAYQRGLSVAGAAARSSFPSR